MTAAAAPLAAPTIDEHRCLVERLPFYGLVPKDVDANLRFRRGLLQRAADCGDEPARDLFRQEQWIMCARDPLYAINAYGWTYDPRLTPSAVPFVTWDYQDRAILDLLDSIDTGEDVVIEKSRDMGASWIMLSVFWWRWMFVPNQSFLMVSRKEEYVDKIGDPKALFWKVDFLLKHMPGWMLPRFERKKLHFGNLDNGSTIDGESTNGDVARGDRRTAICLDEFAAVENGRRVLAATGDATRCRWFNSTPAGTANAFYEVVNSGVRKVRMHWSQHPHKGAGLYTSDEAGRLQIIDTSFVFPDGYQFICDGKMRSPWYDKECKRRHSDLEIKQELDIDYIGSGSLFFDVAELDEHQEKFARDPLMMGELDHELDTLEPKEFVRRNNGKLLLWCGLMSDGKPPPGNYVIGCDVANGTGASNSVACIADRETGEKVAEFASSMVKPEGFAKFAVALARWFHGAMLGWEANGPGRGFGDAVLEAGYRNIYYRRQDTSISRKVSDVPGWFSTADNKTALLTEYRSHLGRGDFVNRSVQSLMECRQYVHGPNGPEHAAAMTTEDPSGARQQHGDRVIADALANRFCRLVKRVEKDQSMDPPVGSFAWRRAERERDRRSNEEGW